MPKKQPDLDALGAQFREAQDAVTAHRRLEVDADMARLAWLQAHRGVPSHELYDRTTGAPLDPVLADLEAGLAKASADTDWCRALVLACGEAYKGEPLDVVIARNEAHREKVAERRRTAGVV